MDILIAEVHKRGVLWEKTTSCYKNRKLIYKEWSAIAKQMGIPREDAKRKWRHLRDQFNKELRKVRHSSDGAPVYTGKWQYFSSLLFLKDVITKKSNGINVPLVLNELSSANEADNEVSIVKMEANDSETCSIGTPHSSSYPKMEREHENESNFELQLHDIENENMGSQDETENENSLFLRSLVPFMKKLDPIRQLRVRTKFQDILLQELVEMQSREGLMPSNSMSYDYSKVSAPASPK